jgi:phenylacetate-CoA ligase
MSSNTGKPKKEISFLKKAYFNSVPFSRRYGKDFYKKYTFLMNSSKWSTEKLLEYQNNEFIRLFDHCKKNVPYYKKLFSEHGLNKSNITSKDDISKIPYLTKKLIIENSQDLVAENLKNSKKYQFSTSGSTGQRLSFFGLDSLYKFEAAFILRAYKLSGGSLYDKPSVWLRRYVPKDSSQPLFYYDYELKRLYLSAYHLNQENIFHYIEKINENNYHTLSTYPSSAYVLAELCSRNNLSIKNIKNIHVASEPLLDDWRHKIHSTFGIYPVAHYGQVEKVSFMNQIYDSKNYFDNLEYGISEYEINNYGHYDLIGTGFNNYLMPFLRYKTEDSVILKKSSVVKGNPNIVDSIIGRSSDILISSNETKVPGVNFYNWVDNQLPGVGLFQIIQRVNKSIDFNFVETINFSEDTIDDIRNGLLSRLGNLSIRINKKDSIQRDRKTGKIKSIINESIN